MIETSQLLITFLINSMWQIPLVAAIAASRQVINIVDKTLTESFPIRNLGVSGKSLSFDWKDPDGDEDHLEFEVMGTDAGRLNWVGLPNGLELPSISVTREAAKTH